MTISSYQVQNILRTYARQLSRGQRMARSRVVGQWPTADQVNISIEARRKQVIERITSEIVMNLGYRLPGPREGLAGVEDQALKELSREYGQPLDIAQDEKSGQLIFKVIDPEQGELVQTLSPEESARLEDRLYAITQEIIDGNMA